MNVRRPFTVRAHRQTAHVERCSGRRMEPERSGWQLNATPRAELSKRTRLVVDGLWRAERGIAHEGRPATHHGREDEYGNQFREFFQLTRARQAEDSKRQETRK